MLDREESSHDYQFTLELAGQSCQTLGEVAIWILYQRTRYCGVGNTSKLLLDSQEDFEMQKTSDAKPILGGGNTIRKVQNIHRL